MEEIKKVSAKREREKKKLSDEGENEKKERKEQGGKRPKTIFKKKIKLFLLTDDAADALHQPVALRERVQDVSSHGQRERGVSGDAHGDVPQGDDGDLLSNFRESAKERKKNEFLLLLLLH